MSNEKLAQAFDEFATEREQHAKVLEMLAAKERLRADCDRASARALRAQETPSGGKG